MSVPAIQEQQGLAYRHELTVEELVLQVRKIHTVMAEVMRPGIEGHYGVIPGTKKPTLLKPGAELLCMLFRLAPEYTSDCQRDGGHLNVKSTCSLRHIPTGMVWATGEALCSTRETKYAYRQSSRTCPSCGNGEAIIKGKAEYGGGWLCFAKKGGCGAKFKDGDAAIEDQQVERVANPDIADTENTVLKIANKRSLIAAVLNATAASEVFTQDMEDANPVTEDKADPPPMRQPAPRQATTTADVRTPEEETGQVTTISEPQVKRFWAIARTSGWKEDEVKTLLGKHKIDSTAAIPVSLYEGLCNTLKGGTGA